jgi:ribose/xylose/arabinose/galactoside ABC-type transport system permease subunit
VVIFALVLLAMGFVLKYTPFGRYTYAIGSNAQTAYHAGVDVDKMLVWIYTILGALVGLAAMVMTSRASSAQPSAGLSLELDVIAAVIIGGCSPSGGKGTMLGTLIGCLLISFLRNGLTLLGVVAQIQLVAVGLIIIIAVTSDRLATKKN